MANEDTAGMTARRPQDGEAEGAPAPARRFRAGLVQMRTGRTVESNLIEASRLIREAVAGGAEYVQTPEITTLMETDRARLMVETRPEEGNPAIAHFRTLARELGVWLHVGSMGIALGGAEHKLANRSFLITPEGRLAARYDKIHMFDVNLPNGQTFRESKSYQPGRQVVIAQLPWARLGLTICYDMRFPQLYRALAQAGAEVIAVPSSFTRPTGEAHWHTLLRSRAIETGCWILAAAQGGMHEVGRETYGHSLIVSPWGEVAAEAAGVEPGVIIADIDLTLVAEARARIPSLEHDRPFEVVHAPPTKDAQ